MVKNPIAIRPDTNIGQIAAEADDQFLFECFFDHPALATLKDQSSPKVFILGRTGAGKTALIRMLKRSSNNVAEVDPLDLSLDYVSNSDIIKFLNSIDVPLDLFFQTLWKHVLIIEFIKMRYAVHDDSSSRGIFDRIFETFYRDGRRKKALAYLDAYKDKFWITMDENIREITKTLEQNINAELGGEVAKFTGRAGYARGLSEEKKSFIQSRARQIVTPAQLSDLSQVLELLEDFGKEGKYKEYYILIDKLDENWVDDSVRFRLIRALIESLKTFGKIHCLKIIVSIRSDVMERVIAENKELGFQREKYADYFLNLTWTKSQLQQLVEKRINHLYKRQYTRDNVFFGDIFPHPIAKKSPFDYIIERTLMRPRDVISFINECLSRSQGQPEIRPNNIRTAELEYSRIRRQALVEEWKSALPCLDILLGLLIGQKDRFFVRDVFTRESVEDTTLKIQETYSMCYFDGVVAEASRYMAGSSNDLLPLIKEIVSQLYRVGIVGLKIAPTEPHIYAHLQLPIVNKELISLETKVHIHPMLHRALNINELYEPLRANSQKSGL